MDKLQQYGFIIDYEEKTPFLWIETPLYECDWVFARAHNLYFLGYTYEEDNAAVFCFNHDKEKAIQLYKQYYGI